MSKFNFRYFIISLATLAAVTGVTSEIIMLCNSPLYRPRNILLLCSFTLLLLACISTFFYETKHRRRFEKTKHMLQFERRLYRSALMADCDYAYTVNVTENKLHTLNRLGYLQDYNFNPTLPFDTAIQITCECMHPAVLIGKSETFYTKDLQAAFDEGKAPVFSRPETIRNSAALLLGTLADTSLFTRENATVSIVTDDTLGSVLSMAVGQGEAEAFVTLDYAALVSALSLAPVHGQNIEYAVLKVKAEMANTASWYISFNSEEGKTASPVTSDEGWQYAVIDLTQDGFEGELQTIEFGLLTTDNTASFLLADLFFVSTAEQVDALVKGGYIFPAREPLPPEISTETTIEEESTVDTQPMDTDSGTESPVDTTSPSAPTETNGETEPFTGGCASSLAMTALIGMILPLTALIALRKKED